MPGGQTLTRSGPAGLRAPPCWVHHWTKYHEGSGAPAEQLMLYNIYRIYVHSATVGLYHIKSMTKDTESDRFSSTMPHDH